MATLEVAQRSISAGPWLLKVIVLGNLAGFLGQSHTRFTYHRTWETGLEVAALAAIADPEFFCPKQHPYCRSRRPQSSRPPASCRAHPCPSGQTNLSARLFPYPRW